MPSQPLFQQFPRLLWFIQLSYTVVILLANWFDVRMVQIFGLATDAGTLIFPFTFILSDLITEVYGYKLARRAIWVGFLFNFMFIAYGQLISHLPSPDYAVAANTQFDHFLTFNLRIILASTLSYFIAEPLNSLVMAKLKLKTQGRLMWLRFVLSTLLAALLDSFIFGCLAFYTTMPVANLMIFNANMWLIKIGVEFLGLPLSLSLAKCLKQYEQLDIYDVGTKFSLFSLNAEYAESNNRFGN